MGAWGTGPFENDTAADWVAEFAPGLIEKTLRAALDASAVHASMDATLAEEALAAVAWVALSVDQDLPDTFYPGDSTSVEIPLSDAQAFKELAARCIPCIAKSESAELWAGDSGWWSNLQRIAVALDCPKDVLGEFPVDFVGMNRPSKAGDVLPPSSMAQPSQAMSTAELDAFRTKGLAALEKANEAVLSRDRTSFDKALGKFWHCVHQIQNDMFKSAPSSPFASMTDNDFLGPAMTEDAWITAMAGQFDLVVREFKNLLQPYGKR